MPVHARSRGLLRLRALMPLVLLLACALAQGCSNNSPPLPPPPPLFVSACLTRQPTPGMSGGTPRTPTAPAGTIPGTFSVTSTGEASYVMPLVAVPGRAGVEPRLAVTYDGAGDGILGAGFSLSGFSAITRCPSNLAQDGEIREVKYDAQDKLCLDGKRLVVVAQGSGTIEYRTFPDTNVKVIGHQPTPGAQPAEATYFEAFIPSGLVIEYGHADSGKPLASNGSAQEWLATKVHDGRGNTMTYAYCSTDGGGYAAEVALDQIRYTSFESSSAPALPASRAVNFIYEAKDPADRRTHYSGGMALQSALRLSEIDMIGPSSALVRRYGFKYGQGPTTSRTLLTAMAECGADGVCKPPTQFQYKSSGPGLKKQATNILAPTSRGASPMLLDIDGDGLDDLVLPDTVNGLSTPGMPITNWTVAHNQGTSPGFFGPEALALSEDWTMVADPTGPSDPTLIQPELGTAIDYNQDGRMDVFLHDVYGSSANWIVLLAQPNHTFKQHDTGIPRPFPLGASPTPPNLASAGAAVHLADVNGDGVPDLIQCDDHSQMPGGNPSQPAWTVHLWKPASGTAEAGFDPAGEDIEPLSLAGYPCNGELYTADVNGDGKVDLVQGSGTNMLPAASYFANTRNQDGTWGGWDTQLPIVPPGGLVLFLDVNGDGLPDAIESGFQDGNLRTWINVGPTFAATPTQSLATGPIIGIGAGGSATAGVQNQDTYFRLAVLLDYNGDGLQDLLMPVPGGTFPNNDVLPAWAILQATGATSGPTFTLVDPHIHFDPALSDSGVSPADPHGPRVGDLDGDGADDVVLPLDGFFTVFKNLAPDQDLLVAIYDGMNAHDLTDPGFVPDVSISYGHLTDGSITSGTPAGDPALESFAYLSRAGSGCTYPIACAVGPRRQVTSYVTNNGADGARHFSVRYRDGRYHRLGRGFLGFAERIVTDLDTHAGTADFYDNATVKTVGAVEVFPYAGLVQREWHWAPGLPSQPDPTQIELSFTDVTPTVVPTNGGATYLALTKARRARREEGAYPDGTSPTVEAYVTKTEASGGATVLRDASTTVSAFDPFGYVQAEDIATVGVDLTIHVERTFNDDTTHWILGQIKAQKECSTASMMNQCRTLTRHTTTFGEVHDDTLGDDAGTADTKLSVTYDRDPFGNVTTVTADDAFGHQRTSHAWYDAEGIYPNKLQDGAGYYSHPTYDPAFGVLATLVDPNNLTTTWTYDSLGRLGRETRPDHTQTTITLSRTKNGGPQGNAWRVTKETKTTGGADDTVELDSLGRPVRWWWHGPSPQSSVPRVMQEIAYDALGEHVARRSVPVSEGTPESAVLYDRYQYDAAGREILRTTPWMALVRTRYDALTTTTTRTDPVTEITVTERDPLDRVVKVTDAGLGLTKYTYGPFGDLYKVAGPDGAVTTTVRDAFGRVRELDDPDRGSTMSTHDGFGELVSSTDALGRGVAYEYDGLGRTTSRTDTSSAGTLTTTWTWDTAANGIGMLADLAGPDADTSYTYTSLGQLHTVTLAMQGQNTLQGTLDYDSDGRVSRITYPTSPGAASFAVTQDYDAFGHVVSVRDSTLTYWQLTDVDNAGRYKTEILGNGVSSTRGYYPDKQSLASIATTHGTTTVQDLAYEYDARLDLASRTDAIQAQNTTERFRYDALERLTCAYFSPTASLSAPCAVSYGYDPNGNGNLTSKSDVGTLTYTDTKHPHAVTGAGTDAFGYDPVGNQTSRPGGTIVAYTPFDLPKTVTQGAQAVAAFGYDGDEQRVRKTTPTEETLYFGDLYERVTNPASPSAPAVERFYVRSPERAVAVVTRGGPQAGTLYLHVDHLGSVETLTDEHGSVVEKRSYDAFGQRRSSTWGQPPPMSFTSLTTEGFTGHESDDQLGLVNMKGRVYDPKVGRFLTTDPIVSAPLSSQSWNPYSYVLNNPLSLVDPSGFDVEEPVRELLAQIGGGFTKTPAGVEYVGPEVVVVGPKPPPTSGGSSVGAVKKPADTGTVGPPPPSSPPGVTVDQPPTEPRGWRANPYVQTFGGFFTGVGLGLAPGGGVAQQLGDATGTLPRGTPEARRGLAVGLLFGGAVTTVGGATGEIAAFLGSLTGPGALAGVPAMAISAGAVVGGLGNMAAGIRGLMTTGSGSGGGIRANAAKGAAFEDKTKAELSKTDQQVTQQVTIETNSGVRTRIDFTSRDASGNLKLTEAKSSPTAPLTRNQRAAFPEIATTGGTVVGKGKPGIPGGTQIPPTNVTIIRP